MIVKPRLYKTLDGRIALVSATLDKGEVVSINGPYSALSDGTVEPEVFVNALLGIIHEARHMPLLVEGSDELSGISNADG